MNDNCAGVTLSTKHFLSRSLKVILTSEIRVWTFPCVHDKHETQQGGDVLGVARIAPAALSSAGASPQRGFLNDSTQMGPDGTTVINHSLSFLLITTGGLLWLIPRHHIHYEIIKAARSSEQCFSLKCDLIIYEKTVTTNCVQNVCVWRTRHIWVRRTDGICTKPAFFRV